MLHKYLRPPVRGVGEVEQRRNVVVGRVAPLMLMAHRVLGYTTWIRRARPFLVECAQKRCSLIPVQQIRVQPAAAAVVARVPDGVVIKKQ